VTHGKDVWIADAPDAFADAVVSLLRDPARRVQLERSARELVVTHYDWSAVAGQLEEALETAAGRRAAAA
jgi:polysaccharide biosynthesis protein PslH